VKLVNQAYENPPFSVILLIADTCSFVQKSAKVQLSKIAWTIAGGALNSGTQSIAGGDAIPHEQVRQLEREDCPDLLLYAVKEHGPKVVKSAYQKVTGKPLPEDAEKALETLENLVRVRDSVESLEKFRGLAKVLFSGPSGESSSDRAAAPRSAGGEPGS
jgi:hypothetical protein